MADAIPPDARKVVLAAVVPCEQCKGTGVRHCGVVDCSTGGEHACTFCLSTGTRTVVTDIEVEQVCIAEEGMYEELVWREVER